MNTLHSTIRSAALVLVATAATLAGCASGPAPAPTPAPEAQDKVMRTGSNIPRRTSDRPTDVRTYNVDVLTESLVPVAKP